MFGSIVVPGSALISLRMMSSPAPEVVLSSRLKACCCSDEDAFITADAWPNASAKPNPAMVWCVADPVMVALSAASAGAAGRTAPSAVAHTNAADPASAVRSGRRGLCMEGPSLCGLLALTAAW